MILYKEHMLFLSVLKILFFPLLNASEYNEVDCTEKLHMVIAIKKNQNIADQLPIKNVYFDRFLPKKTSFFLKLLRIEIEKKSENNLFLKLPWEILNNIFYYCYIDNNFLPNEYAFIDYLDHANFKQDLLPKFLNDENLPIDVNTLVSCKPIDSLVCDSLCRQLKTEKEPGYENRVLILNAFSSNIDIFLKQYKQLPVFQKYLEIKKTDSNQEKINFARSIKKILDDLTCRYSDHNDIRKFNSLISCYIDKNYIFLEMCYHKQCNVNRFENVSNFFNIFYGHVLIICKNNYYNFPCIKKIWLSRSYNLDTANKQTYQTNRIYSIANIQLLNNKYVVTINDATVGKFFEIHPFAYHSKNIYIKTEQFPICNPVYWEQFLISAIQDNQNEQYTLIEKRYKDDKQKRKASKERWNFIKKNAHHIRIAASYLTFYIAIEYLLYRTFGASLWHKIPMIGLICFSILLHSLIIFVSNLRLSGI